MAKDNKKIYTLLYSICFCFFLVFCFLIIKNKVLDYKGNINPIPLLLTTLFFILFSYIANYFYSKSKNTSINMYWNLVVYFFMYILLVFIFTGRNLSFSINNIKDFSANLVPFKEILSVLNSNDFAALALLIGNILLLSPCAIFLPRIIKSTQKFSLYFISIFLFAVSIELIQSFFGVGVFDIDDILLNTSGALLAFFLCNKTSLSALLNKVLLLEKVSISKLDILKCISVVIIISASIGLCIYYYYFKTPGIEVEWINESTTCKSERILLYEDKLKYYYYPCENIDDIYLLIDKRKKIKLKDVIENRVPKKYKNYLGSSLISSLPDIEIEEKYLKLELFYETSTNIRTELQKTGIIALQDGKQTSSSEGNSLSYILYPLAEGNVELYVEFYDIKTQKVRKKVTYQVEVDKENKVSIRSEKIK